MRNKQLFKQKIVELNAIKSCYNHYLASGRSIFEVENATQVHYNLCVINRTLRELYKEVKEVDGCWLMERPHPQPLSKGEGSKVTASPPTPLQRRGGQLHSNPTTERPHPRPFSKGEGSSFTQAGIEHQTSDSRQPKTINQKLTTANQLTSHFKQLEMKAIMLFNADRRFTITE